MTSIVPFRQSSFFFGRQGSYGVHSDAANSAAGATAGEAHDEEGQGLLEGHDMESCQGDLDSFAFSWKRLLLHVGCVQLVLRSAPC